MIGGIRTVENALDWINAGAARVVIGTASTTEFLSQVFLKITGVAFKTPEIAHSFQEIVLWWP